MAKRLVSLPWRAQLNYRGVPVGGAFAYPSQGDALSAIGWLGDQPPGTRVHIWKAKP